MVVARTRLRIRLRHWKAWTAWWLLFALYLGVRSYHLEQTPERNATADEFAWTWSGMTLLQTGTPQAWSSLTAYIGRRHSKEWHGHKYRLVKPWLDHPPLYSLYAGGLMLALGKRSIFDVDLWQMRMGSLFLDAVGFVLLSLVLRRLLATTERLLALLFYSVMPAIVLHQRLVVSENFYVPLTLGIVLMLLQQRSRFSWWRAGAIMFCCALLPMTKVAALSASVFLAMWALVNGAPRERWIAASAVVLGTCVGLGAYVWYGQQIDAAVFWAVLTNQQDRFRGLAGMEVLLFEPKLVNHQIKDLLAVVGCALALASLSLPRVTPWGLAVLVYAACMAFFVDQNRVYGWYYIPLYPWLCTALAVSIAHASRQRVLGLSLLWCSVAALTIASVSYSQLLVTADRARFGYLIGLLLLYGSWAAWPRLARATMPAVNGLLVACAAIACLVEVYAQ
jgi:hypothetical protein